MHCMGSKVFRSFCLAKVTQKVPEVFTQQTSGEGAAALGVPAPGAPAQSQLPVPNPSLLKYAEANIIAPEWGTKQRQKQNGWKTTQLKRKKKLSKRWLKYEMLWTGSTHTGVGHESSASHKGTTTLTTQERWAWANLLCSFNTKLYK